MASILDNVYRTETNLAHSNYNNARNATSTNIIPQTGFNQKILNNNNTGFPQDNISREIKNGSSFVSSLSGENINKEGFHDNMVPFIKMDAENELERLFGWQKFKHKHFESRFTRFYEDFWLPRKFGFEKRRAHFSSLITTNQMTREQALARISQPEMDEHTLKLEFEYISNKLDLTIDQLQAIFDGENKTYRDYRNKRWLIGLGTYILRWIGVEKRFFR